MAEPWRPSPDASRFATSTPRPFAADHSDVLVVETEDIDTYYYFVEKLRDSDVIANGWAEITDISIGMEDGYKEYARHHV